MAVVFVGGDMVAVVLGVLPMEACSSISMRAQGELLHLLKGAGPFNLGREGRVLSSKVETYGIATWLGH